ncbi:MAG: hypothetical protein JXM71_09130 [Spirochaetales bacterium]|nr:hypothetical protein [Spirochaetales bacterium]
MNDGKGRPGFLSVLLIIVFSLAYFLVCAEPLQPELSAVPRWRVEIPAASIAGAVEIVGDDAMAFQAGGRFGYFSPDGDCSFMSDSEGCMAIGDSAYAKSNAAGGSELVSPDGQSIAQIASDAPFFSAGRLFSADGDGTGITSYNATGDILWSYSFPCHLSALSAGSSLIVGGTIDGWIEGVSPYGKKAFTFAPGGSRLSVVLGLGVSRSGNWVAAVTGIDRQRLIVLGQGGADYRVTSHRYLESDYREPVRVIVMDDEQHVLYRRADGVGVWSVDGTVDEILPVKADDFSVAMDEAHGVSYMMARRGKHAEIVVFKNPATLLGRVALPDYTDFVRFSGSSVYVGGSTWLARFDFVEE